MTAEKAAQERVAEAEWIAEERVRTPQQDRDDGVTRAQRPSEGAEDSARTAEQEALLERSKDKAAGLRLTRKGSLLGELVDGVYEAMDWLLDCDT